MRPLGVAVDVLSKWIADKSQVYTQHAYMRQFFFFKNKIDFFLYIILISYLVETII